MLSITVPVLIAIAIVCGAFNRKLESLTFTGLALATGIGFGNLNFISSIPIISIGVFLHLWVQSQNGIFKRLYFVLSVAGCVALGLKVVPGFQAINLGSHTFGHSLVPYDFTINLDKWFAGSVVSAFIPNLLYKGDTTENIKKFWYVLVFVPILLAMLGYLLGVQLDVKADSYILLFLLSNAVVCVCEEIFYRLMIQERIWDNFGGKTGFVIGTLVFIATHYSSHVSSATIVILFSAGLCYALAYKITRSFSGSVAVHLMSNMVHIVFLTYPLT